MSLYLDMLRHGATLAGPGFRGSSDDALSEQGWQQMHQALAGQGPWDLVISSPLQRCAVFATQYAEANGLPLRIEADLRELHFGAWEGRNSAEILLENPEALGQFWNDPYRFTPPEAEPVREFANRVLAAVERLQAELAGQRVLLVTHGGVMRLLLARARGLPESQLLQVEVGYGALHGLQVGANLALSEA
ncbi:alpha-ribazole phosphatase family protein [Pseudomonas sp. BMS12]|uniref:alpha-ribazole phosphatase family protein n=1 Tax=Pseudomonas sp. BMS12 TaxID=1796033 RepID=UPI00083B2978|nr:alpha-ribazole phosphatase family protein [Pseudomonas sp. BMS12]